MKRIVILSVAGLLAIGSSVPGHAQDCTTIGQSDLCANSARALLLDEAKPFQENLAGRGTTTRRLENMGLFGQAEGGNRAGDSIVNDAAVGKSSPFATPKTCDENEAFCN